jgi:hypothetical protein
MSTTYLGNPLLKRSGVKLNFTEEQVLEYVKCADDPEYFIEKYIKIVNVDRGLVPFTLYPYQKRLIESFEKHRFTIAKIGRQMGKSVTVVSYFLWMVLFHDQQNIAILANKGSLARELLAKIKLAYEYLPTWLQQGITTWNKGNIELENGSKILAASTTSSAVRGGSFNCIAGDSRIDIKINDQLYSVSIQHLHHIMANSSRRCINTTDVFLDELEDVNVFREQIHQMVLGDHQKTSNASSNVACEICHQSTSYHSEMYGRNEFVGQSSEIDNTRTFSSPSIINSNGRNILSQAQDALCVHQNALRPSRIYDRTQTNTISQSHTTTQRNSAIVSNGEDPLISNETENESIIEGAGCDRRHSTQNQSIEDGSTQRSSSFTGILSKNISDANWKKENRRPCSKNQQQSGENSQDCGYTSWYETQSRIETSYVDRGQGAHSLEQRIQVRTASGWKAFSGVRETQRQSTLTITLSGGQTIRCTPDHLIHTDLGWIPAKSIQYRTVYTTSGLFTVDSLTQNAELESVYDLLEVEETQSFYANDMLVHNCVFLDEFAFVQPNMATEFFASVYPVISSGKSTKLFIVSTPNGLNHYYKMWMDAVNKKSLYNPVEVEWNAMPGRDEAWKAETIRNTSEEQWKQEYGCVAEDTEVQVRDRLTGEISTMTIGDLYLRV